MLSHSSIRVMLARDSYDILIGRGLLDAAGALLRETLSASRVLLLTDERVSRLYGDRVERALRQSGFETARLALPPGEEAKSLQSLPLIYSALANLGVTRSDALIALGGGVVGDLGGFAAATYLRGIGYAQIPTTLLAQVDSSVGGKTGVDLPEGKNLVGCFYQPKRVIVDPDALATLAPRVYSDGMGEVIKYAAAFDGDLFPLLTPAGMQNHARQIIKRCLNIKRRLVEADERDTGERMLLNFGHTLGHAIEAAQRYQGMTHGEAVAAGMCLITRMTEQRGLTQPGAAETLEALCRAWNLPTTCDRALWPAMRQALSRDKKHLNRVLNAVLLRRLGEARVEKVDLSFFEEVLPWLTSSSSPAS